MSHVENEKWIEAADEHLDGAIEEGNYALCKDIIADTIDAGYLAEARAMVIRLREAPIENFINKKVYPLA